MEHNIILIKPDQEKHEWFTESIQDDLVQNSFEIVAVASKQLSETEFEKCFICKNSEHLVYMTSGPITALLFKGCSAVSFGRNYKYKIRKQHSTGKLRNILHSTEPGNEFTVQFGLFFPTLNIDDHHQFADQGVVFDCLDQGQSEELSKLSSFNLIASDEEQAGSAQFRAISSLSNCRYVAVRDALLPNVEILRFRRKNACFSDNASEVKVLLLKDLSNHPTLIKFLKEKHKIQGVVCCKPSFTLLETEMLRTATFENGLFCVGGSFGEKASGFIRASQEIAAQLDAAFDGS
ncbi:nucleoside-diphosphate kinase [Pseudovibrio sp. SCP19]|uniref:nucleoside-diphosphate kinase n=1 Tax=Pseudovibrio sp. SCP19 TaxID=3141374 RepID=UPI00333E1318